MEISQPRKRKRRTGFNPQKTLQKYGILGNIILGLSYLAAFIAFPFGACCYIVKMVTEYERAVVFRLGRLQGGGAKGPGLFCILPCTDTFRLVDLRTKSFNVPPQEILTKDSVTIKVDAVVYYRVQEPQKSVANVKDSDGATQMLAQTTLRNILGTKTLQQVLSDRKVISSGMQSILDESADRWGIKVERVEIKDVSLPTQLQRAMAAEAEADREAKAKVIAADGEMKAARKLKEAADEMSKNSNSMQLRYLQTLTSISAEQNSTIVFPIPIDLMRGLANK